MKHPVVIEGLSPQLTKLLSPDAPSPMRMMAAGGLAPLPPQDMVVALYTFAFGDDAPLADKARNTLQNMPPNVLQDVLNRDVHPGILDGLSQLLHANVPCVESIILNRNTAGETIVRLAKTLHSEKHLEMIAANEQRLLAHPDIIAALYNNRATRMSTVDRAIELAVRNGIVVEGISAFEEAQKAIEGQLVHEAPEDDEMYPEDLEFTSALEADIARDVDEEKVVDILDALATGTGDSTSEETTTVSNLATSLSELNVSQKIRVATLGNSSQRAVLIRDSNKLVIMAVLKSPALSDAEIMRYSAARSLPDEAIRYICAKRDWIKHYSVKVNLVNNPKTPLSEALRFLNHLRPNDIRSLERSKDVSGVVKNAAKELRQKRSR
ncbi:MAG: hypothetical protein M0R76_08325 [Proteobacteria bacterium]|nr:hypothetical protein [Pseudomonadota bacterium]